MLHLFVSPIKNEKDIPKSFPYEIFFGILPRLPVFWWQTQIVGIKLVVKEWYSELKSMSCSHSICSQHIKHIQVLHKPPAVLISCFCTGSLYGKDDVYMLKFRLYYIYANGTLTLTNWLSSNSMMIMTNRFLRSSVNGVSSLTYGQTNGQQTQNIVGFIQYNIQYFYNTIFFIVHCW